PACCARPGRGSSSPCPTPGPPSPLPADAAHAPVKCPSNVRRSDASVADGAVPNPLAVTRSGLLRWIALALIGGVVATGVVVSAFVILAVQSVTNLTFRPTQATALAAYMAASRCDFTPDVKL